MEFHIILLCLINMCGSMGYSLIAPWYTPLALDKGVSLKICGLVFASFSMSQILTVVYSPYWIKVYGRKKLFIYGCTVQMLCIFSYGPLKLVDNLNTFWTLSFVIRLWHGFGCSVLNVIAYSWTSLITDPRNIKIAMGQMELAWGFGFTLGPLWVSVFYMIGGYYLPFVASGLISSLSLLCSVCLPFSKEELTGIADNLNQSPQIEMHQNNELTRKVLSTGNSDNKSDLESSVIPLLKNLKILIICTCCMVQWNAITFFFPTWSTHLMDTYNVSLSFSSLFFIITQISYFITLQYLNEITDYFGMKLTMAIGSFLSFLGLLFVAPAAVLPQSSITLALGLLITGGQSSLINVPVFLEIQDILKSEGGRSEGEAADKSSALFNWSFNLGDLWSPAVGAYITEKSGFKMSCYFSALLSLCYSGVLYYSFKDEIEMYWEKRKGAIEDIKNKLLNIV